MSEASGSTQEQPRLVRGCSLSKHDTALHIAAGWLGVYVEGCPACEELGV